MIPAEALPRRLTPLSRALFRSCLRLVVAYAIVTLLIYHLRPQITQLLGEIACKIIMVSSPIPYLADFGSTDAGFVISDRILNRRLHQLTLWPELLFTFGFPFGIALAIPGIRTVAYWHRLCWTFIGSVVVCSALLALTTDWKLTEEFANLGIRVHPPWYDGFLRRIIPNLWDIAVVLFPFVSLLWLARSSLASGGFGSQRTSPLKLPLERLPTHCASLVALAALALLAWAIELRATQARARPRQEVFQTLSERNPDLGNSLIRFADSLAAQGRYRDAWRWYLRASQYEGNETRARTRMRRLQAMVSNRPDAEPDP